MRARTMLGITLLAAPLLVLALLEVEHTRAKTDADARAVDGSTGTEEFGGQRPRANEAVAAPGWDGSALEKTLADRRVRDDLRRRIINAWAAAATEAPSAAAPIPPMPTGSDGKVDAEYIRDVVRSDLKPLVQQCFNELSARKPNATGRISLTFRIVGDDKIGGIVDDATLAVDAGPLAEDETFASCVHESAMSLAFRPPVNDTTVVVPLSVVFEGRDDRDN